MALDELKGPPLVNRTSAKVSRLAGLIVKICGDIPPTIKITPISTDIFEGEMVTFNWSISDPSNVISITEIIFENKAKSWSSGHQWIATEGNHSLKIMVTDHDGFITSEQIDFFVTHVDPFYPIVTLEKNTITATTGETITFNWTSYDGGSDIISTIVTLNDVEQNWKNGHHPNNFHPMFF